jgi:hypothetical protein
MSLTKAFERLSVENGLPDEHEEIEQRLIRAFLQLALSPPRKAGSHSVVIRSQGLLEVRMTERWNAMSEQFPTPFRLEVYSHACGDVIHAMACHELDDGGLDAAVEFVVRALGTQPALN